LKKFGYSGAQAYSILGTAPCQGHISGVVDVPNACATLWLPTEIFDFDVMPSSAGPIKHIKGDIQMPISPDKGSLREGCGTARICRPASAANLQCSIARGKRCPSTNISATIAARSRTCGRWPNAICRKTVRNAKVNRPA
jgi:hypothetical protein